MIDPNQPILEAAPVGATLPPKASDGVDGSASVDIGIGQVATIGGIQLCTTGKTGAVQLTRVRPLRGSAPLRIVGFAVRDIGNQFLGYSQGTLAANGFPATAAQVTPCNAHGRERATKELGVAVERVEGRGGEDHGLILTYQDETGQERSLIVDFNLTVSS